MPVRLLALLVAPLLVLAGCGGDDSDGGSSSPSEIEVTGGFGEAPKVDIPKNFSVDDSDTTVLHEGDGDQVDTGDEVLVQVAAYNGTSGAEIANMFSGQAAQPQSMKVDDSSSLLPGLTDGITGQTIGSRLLLSITPEDGFGDQGNPQVGIGPDDTVVAVVDVLPVSEAPKPTGSIDDVSVSGAPGAKPSAEFEAPLYVDETQSKVINEGDGAVVKKDDVVQVDYVGVNGRTGKEFDSSYGDKSATPAEFPLSEGQLIPGFIKGLVGQRLGSRVAIAIPRDDGYGPAGSTQAGIKGTDTLVFVVDLHKPPPQPAATGSVDDITVTGEPGKQPKVTFDKPFYVEQTQSKVLEEGSGEPLKPGDTVSVNYTGINGRTGRAFDGNFGSAPAEFTLDEKSLIPGFIEGLVGKKPGSRVVIAIPRDDGYGESGNPKAGIKGTDTLVFVLDIAPAAGSGD